MDMIRVASVLSLAFLAACTIPSSGAPAGAAAPPAAEPPAPGQDALRLTTGEVVRGRILEETPRSVTIDRGDYTSTYPRTAIASIDATKQRPLPTPPLAPDGGPGPLLFPPTSWLPPKGEHDPVEHTEVLFHDTHEPADCLGPDLARAGQELPDAVIFADPGGQVRVLDPKKWGYHAHLAPKLLRVPVAKPGLTIEVPKDEARLPEWMVVASPAQEIQVTASEEGGKPAIRSSYAIPDALHLRLRPLSAAGGMLSAQPFSLGKPAPTPNGTMWAFTLPRNHRQFLVYLLDPDARHGQILNASYAGYGETLLAADLIVDTVGADGITRGRLMVLPYPDGVSADGPGLEALTIYAGPLGDPTTILKLALPPREAVQVPVRAASTRADLLVSHYDVSRSIPQSIILAHGTGRPTQGVTMVSRELTAESPDEVVKIDLSSLPEERFPAVAWLYQRRAFLWRLTSGALPQQTPPTSIPSGRPSRLKKVKRHESIAHLLPLVFTGPKPLSSGSGASDVGAGVAGGMANAILRESLSRSGSSGGGGAPLAIPSGSSSAGGSGEPQISNVTYVYITAPAHVPAGDLGGAGALGNLSGQYQSYTGMTNVGPNPFPGQTFNTMQPMGTMGSGGQIYNPQGSMIYDPATGEVKGSRGNTQEEIQVDAITRNPIYTVRRSRQ
jgi:hypothetical protein